jgi:hypothetical protein
VVQAEVTAQRGNEPETVLARGRSDGTGMFALARLTLDGSSLRVAGTIRGPLELHVGERGVGAEVTFTEPFEVAPGRRVERQMTSKVP